MSKRDEERPPPLNETKVLGWIGVIVLSCVTFGVGRYQFFLPEQHQDPSLIACGLVLIMFLICCWWIMFLSLGGGAPSDGSALDTIRNQNATRDAKFAKVQQVDHALRGWEGIPPLKFED